MNKKLIATSVAAFIIVASATPANAAVTSWGLDRLDSAKLDNSYSVPYTGKGVTAYVIDSGVNISDSGFGGRASGDLDCIGHGTHVAGTIGSSQFGVATGVKIVSIKATSDCSGGVYASSLVKAIDTAIAMNKASGNGPAVANISITISKSAEVDAAIDRMYAARILPVVAASNSNTDACQFSPSGTGRAFVVGSINKNDYRTSTSAYGPCVDIFAPGGLIISENMSRPDTALVMSGTSMAAPHVTGVASLYLEKYPNASPAEVAGALRGGALAGVVVDAKSDNGNYLVNTAFLSDGAPVAPIASGATEKPARVVGLVAKKAIIAKSYTLYWTAPLNGVNALINSYIIEGSQDGKSWSVIGAPSSSVLNYTVSIYKYYRITAVGALGYGPVSSTLMVR